MWNWNTIISAAEGVQNYLKIILATLNMLENIHELQEACEIILKQFQASFCTLK